jgi:hypothetical protein
MKVDIYILGVASWSYICLVHDAQMWMLTRDIVEPFPHLEMHLAVSPIMDILIRTEVDGDHELVRCFAFRGGQPTC